MPIKAGQIVIDVTAGTSKFVVDMEKAKGKIREFGSAGVSEGKATKAAFKALEGQMFDNKRAAEQFAEKLLGVGAITKVAFPLIGGLAFGGMLGELGVKVHDFFKEMKEAPEKIGAAFRTLNDPLRLTNDQLQVANDRLENDIAKLEGKRQNTLKLALDEARAAADKLADSLDKDLSNLNRLLKEENVSFWRKLFGEAGTGDLKKEFGGETGHEGFIGRINEITDEGNQKIRAATDLKSKDAAQTELNTRLLAAYREEIGKVNGMIATAQHLQHQYEHPVMDLPSVTGDGRKHVEQNITTDQTARLAILRGALRQLGFEMDSVSLQGTNNALTGRKDALTAAAENAELGKPFADRMKALNAQLDGAKAKLVAIGQLEWAQNLLKSFEEGRKAVEEVNKALEKHHTKLTDAQAGQITLKELEIAQAESEAQWKTKLEASTTSINDRVRAQQLLTAAIGRGYEATKRANVETQLMGALGQHYNDAEWMKGHQSEVGGLRDKFGAEYDAKHAEAVTASIQKLKEQTELERSLAQVQSQGAEAVRLVTLAYRLRTMVAEGATRGQIKAEIDLFNATRANASAEALDKITQKTAAVKRLTAAVFEGAEAQRKATLENKYAEMAHGGSTPAEIAAERALDQAGHQHQITEEAGKTVTVYGDQLRHLNDIEDALKKEKKDHGDTLEIEIALRDVENERLRLAVQQELKLKGAKDGLKAFFLEMQEDAKHASDVIYEALNSALDRTSDQFAKLLTHQKTSFGQMFQDIGQEMVKSSVKSMMQKGLSEFGEKVLHIHPGDKKPKGTSDDPLYVVVTDEPEGKDDTTTSALSGLGGLGKIGGIFKTALGGIGGVLGKLFGGGGGDSLTESVSSGVQWMADGGDVYPGNTYGVAEAGEFEIFQPKGPGTITPAHKLGGNSYTYHVDARGADLGVAGRVEAAIRAAHNSAVEQSVKASAERGRRSPQRSS